MGFFSQLCKGCNHSIRADVAVNSISQWMNEAVVLLKEGGRVMGLYDGYGRLMDRRGECEDEDENLIGEDNEVWHRTCWHLSGKPTKFKSASVGATDQGYFVGEYDPPEPQTVKDMNRLSFDGECNEKERKAAWRRAMQEAQKAMDEKDSLDSAGL